MSRGRLLSFETACDAFVILQLVFLGRIQQLGNINLRHLGET
jgi:hypothetical protein